MPRLQDVEFPITGRPTFSSDFSIVKPTHALIAASLVLSMPVCAPAAEVPEPAVVATASDNAAAKALLERAVARYRTDGNAAPDNAPPAPPRGPRSPIPHRTP